MEGIIRFAIIESDCVGDGLENPRITNLFRHQEDATIYIQNRLIAKWRKILTQNESWQAENEFLWILISFLDEDYQLAPLTDAQMLVCIQKIHANPALAQFHLVQLKEVLE
jgi:hypothetical protein